LQTTIQKVLNTKYFSGNIISITISITIHSLYNITRDLSRYLDIIIYPIIYSITLISKGTLSHVFLLPISFDDV
jgi:hypothetical protein